MSAQRPRISVCLPTYNRADLLQRAIASVQAQTFTDFELLISDNASTDDTADVCRQVAAADPRVSVLRHEVNAGLTANFNAVLSAGRADLVMVLADDDWLDPGYVGHCVAFLDAHPGHVLASGSAQYHRGDELRGPGVDVWCEQEDPRERVRSFFAQVTDNAAIYGVLRRSALGSALPMPNALAGDWMLIGRMLMEGKLATVPAAILHRSVGGTSASFRDTARSMGLTWGEEHHPHLAMARLIRRDIALDAPAYATLSPRERRRLGRACAAAILRTRRLNVIDDAVRPLLDHPRMQPLDRAIRRRVRGDDDLPYLP